MQPDTGDVTSRELQSLPTRESFDFSSWSTGTRWQSSSSFGANANGSSQKEMAAAHRRIAAQSRTNVAASEHPFDDMAITLSELAGDVT
jgi:hypothetical protein